MPETTHLQRAERASDAIAASITTLVEFVAEMNPAERVVFTRRIDDCTASEDETFAWNKLSPGEQRTLLMAWHLLQIGQLLGHVDEHLQAVVGAALGHVGQQHLDLEAVTA